MRHAGELEQHERVRLAVARAALADAEALGDAQRGVERERSGGDGPGGHRGEQRRRVPDAHGRVAEAAEGVFERGDGRLGLVLGVPVVGRAGRARRVAEAVVDEPDPHARPRRRAGVPSAVGRVAERVDVQERRRAPLGLRGGRVASGRAGAGRRLGARTERLHLRLARRGPRPLPGPRRPQQHDRDRRQHGCERAEVRPGHHDADGREQLGERDEHEAGRVAAPVRAERQPRAVALGLERHPEVAVAPLADGPAGLGAARARRTCAARRRRGRPRGRRSGAHPARRNGATPVGTGPTWPVAVSGAPRRTARAAASTKARGMPDASPASTISASVSPPAGVAASDCSCAAAARWNTSRISSSENRASSSMRARVQVEAGERASAVPGPSPGAVPRRARPRPCRRGAPPAGRA